MHPYQGKAQMKQANLRIISRPLLFLSELMAPFLWG